LRVGTAIATRARVFLYTRYGGDLHDLHAILCGFLVIPRPD